MKLIVHFSLTHQNECIVSIFWLVLMETFLSLIFCILHISTINVHYDLEIGKQTFLCGECMCEEWQWGVAREAPKAVSDRRALTQCQGPWARPWQPQRAGRVWGRNAWALPWAKFTSGIWTVYGSWRNLGASSLTSVTRITTFSVT